MLRQWYVAFVQLEFIVVLLFGHEKYSAVRRTLLQYRRWVATHRKLYSRLAEPKVTTQPYTLH
eukprot:m.571829 g.571829  ORF g.571829 m.571829 type:complete len:63 (+) comp22268_c0_seq25:581-769(+)